MTMLPGWPCHVCRRASDGTSIHLPGHPVAQFCGAECARIYMTKTPVKPDEKTAAVIGGNAGGQYLDSIGIFDLRQLSPDQWAEFCGRIFQGTCEELQRRANDEIPF